MLNSQPYTVNLSTARKNLSAILDRVFVNDEVFVIVKGTIPIGKITKAKPSELQAGKRAKKLDLSLFGYLKDDKRNSLKIERELRTKAWSPKD